MKPMQYDIERHTPAKLAEAYRVAAETEISNPFFPPEERTRRAQEFRELARQFERGIK